jgi:hypothetical protein
LPLKGSAIFTAEPQRTLREIFFSFPLRGRKAKILSPTGHDGIISRDRYLFMMLVQHSTAVCFPFAVLSTYSLCELCDSSEAGGEKYSLTYPHNKTGTISIAEGLKVFINFLEIHKQWTTGN